MTCVHVCHTTGLPLPTRTTRWSNGAVPGCRYSGGFSSGNTWNAPPVLCPSGSGVGMVSALCAAAALCSTRSMPMASGVAVPAVSRMPTQNRWSVTVEAGSRAVTDVQPGLP